VVLRGKERGGGRERDKKRKLLVARIAGGLKQMRASAEES